MCQLLASACQGRSVHGDLAGVQHQLCYIITYRLSCHLHDAVSVFGTCTGTYSASR